MIDMASGRGGQIQVSFTFNYVIYVCWKFPSTYSLSGQLISQVWYACLYHIVMFFRLVKVLVDTLESLINMKILIAKLQIRGSNNIV